MAAKRCLLNSSPVLRMTCQMKRNKEDSPFQLASPLTRSALPGWRNRRPVVGRGSRLRGIVASRAAVDSCVHSQLKHPCLIEPLAAYAVARSRKLQSCRRRLRPDQMAAPAALRRSKQRCRSARRRTWTRLVRRTASVRTCRQARGRKTRACNPAAFSRRHHRGEQLLTCDVHTVFTSMNRPAGRARCPTGRPGKEVTHCRAASAMPMPETFGGEVRGVTDKCQPACRSRGVAAAARAAGACRRHPAGPYAGLLNDE